jgi:hypothetical protein
MSAAAKSMSAAKGVSAKAKSLSAAKSMKSASVVSNVLLTRCVRIPISAINLDKIDDLLLYEVRHSLKGKCIPEGYVPQQTQDNKIKIIAKSEAKLRDDFIEFDLLVECSVYFPYEKLILPDCKVKQKLQVGVRAEFQINHGDGDGEEDEENVEVPIVIFLLNENSVKTLEVGQEITVKVIDSRFSINDTFITVIAEYMP